uniref:Regulatory protein zeste n=1 Tax=Caenorhabditis japonica TaxID=281687 RepID=A0A8R1IKM8_CAEJA
MDVDPKRVKAAPLTAMESLALVEFVIRDWDAYHARFDGASKKKLGCKKDDFHQKWAKEVTNVDGTVQRTAKQIGKRVEYDIKAARAHLSAERIEANRTGGGRKRNIVLDPARTRLVEFLHDRSDGQPITMHEAGGVSDMRNEENFEDDLEDAEIEVDVVDINQDYLPNTSTNDFGNVSIVAPEANLRARREELLEHEMERSCMAKRLLSIQIETAEIENMIAKEKARSLGILVPLELAELEEIHEEIEDNR